MRSTARRPGGRGPAVLLLSLIALVLAACGGMAGGPGGGPAATGAPAPAFGGDGEQSGNGNGGPTSGGGGTPRTAPEDLLIIKTGTMTLQVTGIDTALTAASQQITTLGGYASASNRSGDGESAFASITFRIPADRWDDALVGLRGLA